MEEATKTGTSKMMVVILLRLRSMKRVAQAEFARNLKSIWVSCLLL